MAILEGSIQHWRLSAGAWTTNNPVLLDGQIGIEIGTPDKVKIGDGATTWNDLEYSSGILGAPGNDGLSAYEIAVANGFVGDEAAWITSLQGSPGGDGLSAYEIAVANGFVGSVGSWIISLQGSDGAPGAAGFASEFYLGSVTSNSISTGIKTFVIGSNNPGYSIGSRIRAYHDSINYMEGVCIGISGTSISINVTDTVGSGSHTPWSFAVAGERGNNGQGVPAGGAALQALRKVNGTDYNTEWFTVVDSIAYGLNASSDQVAAGATSYYGPYAGLTGDGSEVSRRGIMPVAGTIKRLYVEILSTQPASGTLVFTMRKEGSSQSVTVTVPASATAAIYSDTTNLFTIQAGDRVAIQAVNNASASSAQVGAITFILERN